MSAIWQAAPAPFIDPTGAPYAGLRAYFYDAGTTTPRTTYREAGLGQPHGHPVIANAGGIFPAVFLQPGDYRVRLETADGSTLSDVDGITTPGASSGGTTPTPDTAVRTGDIILRYGADVRDGFVRANSRTIGSAASGATERANADTAALFAFLWPYQGLIVSGGRGTTASGDFSANKTISLPDLRGRTFSCVDDFGAGFTGIIPTAIMDAQVPASAPGATTGAAQVILSTAQMPAHNHGGNTGADGGHSHTYFRGDGVTVQPAQSGFIVESVPNQIPNGTSTADAHTHGIAVDGAGNAHPNMQPTAFIGAFIKL